MNYIETDGEYISACRLCNADRSFFTTIIDLGHMPLANALLSIDDLTRADFIEKRYPLEVVMCKRCCLVQLTYTIKPSILFDIYPYFSSFSQTVVDNAKDITAYVIKHYLPQLSIRQEDILCAEIASNDGYLLQFYKETGHKVLGIEPAQNVAQTATDKGITTLNQYFNEQLAINLSADGLKANVVHANNVLAHVANTQSFVRGIKHFLSPDGLAIIEVPYVKELIDHLEFDTIYHEHLCYFSLYTLQRLFLDNGLKILDVDLIPIHGGSIRLFIGHAHRRHLLEGGYHISYSDMSMKFMQLVHDEWHHKVCSIEYYQKFAERINGVKDRLRSLLSALKESKMTIAGYGASAKGAILLNYCQLGLDFVDYIVDSNPIKQDKYMPGVHIPIISPDKLKADYTLILSWNLANEIMLKERAYRESGGKFIIPIPDLNIL